MNMDLVVLAAGMGSRFGGSKQTQAVDENGNFIIDYSIFDALKVGFDRIVLVIKKEHLEVFEKTIGSRVPKGKIVYAFQTNDILTEKGIDRVKPLGTGQAVLCTRDIVGENNFCMINADDFYGRQAFQTAFDFLKTLEKDSMNFGLVCYRLRNTLSENGSVKRGICSVDDGFVTNIIECSVSENKDPITIKTLSDGKEIAFSDDLFANMNMFCLTPAIFSVLEKGFKEFCEDPINLQENEYLFPTVVGGLTKRGDATLKLLKTNEKWIGMTYRDDLDFVQKSIKELVDVGKYPTPLWKNN